MSLSRILHELCLQQTVPGAVVGIVRPDGEAEVVCAGMASLRPRVAMASEHVFHLFSATKTYTAALVLGMAEDGLLRLDDTVQRWLPQAPLPYRVTLWQLLTHTSGLADTLQGFLSVHGPGDAPPSAGEALSRYHLDEGQDTGRVSYVNVGYALLGHIVELAAQAPFATLLRERVLEPLGSSAAVTLDGLGDRPWAVGHHPRSDAMAWLLPWLVPGRTTRTLFRRRVAGLLPLRPYALDTAAIGGLMGSVHDFVPMVQDMLRPGDGALSATVKRTLLTRQASGQAGVVADVGVGMGWKAGDAEGHRFWTHEGGGAGYCTETRLYPSDGLGIVVLLNRSQSASLSRQVHVLCESIRREAAQRPEA